MAELPSPFGPAPAPTPAPVAAPPRAAGGAVLAYPIHDTPCLPAYASAWEALELPLPAQQAMQGLKLHARRDHPVRKVELAAIVAGVPANAPPAPRVPVCAVCAQPLGETVRLVTLGEER